MSEAPASMARRANIFVVGLDERHRRQLESLRRADEFQFHTLVQRGNPRSDQRYSASGLIAKADEELRRFDGTVDAIVGYWDFPVSTTLPILRCHQGLPGVSLESLLRCEHKYWCRLEQRRCIPDVIPDFCAVDPFAKDVRGQIDLDYPFWMKPVKSVLSHLGFCVHDDTELAHAIERIRAGIHVFATPFNEVLELAELPAEIADVDGNHCIVESLISQGRQCTLEGWALGDEIEIYGVVDSIREGAKCSSFSRYQYPSSLPASVTERMGDFTKRFLRHIGFEGSPFNAELYWDEEEDRIWLLEINPRISKSHCPLFKMVDGEYHHQVMIDVALERRPEIPHREGEHAVAAKFMWRHHRDAIVRKVPSREECEAIRREIPGIEIELAVEAGMRLSDLTFQDSYSYELATIFVGGESEDELVSRYEACRKSLGLELEDA